MACALIWLRRDLRLADNPALQAVLRAGDAPVFVYVHAPHEDAPWPPGAASRAWLDRSLRALDAGLRARGSRLIVRSGDSLAELEKLIAETKATALHWNRLYEPAGIARDSAIKAGLKSRRIDVHSHNAALLFEPWTIANKAGDPYRVFTPFWKGARAQLPPTTIAAPPARLPEPPLHLLGLDVDDLRLRPPAGEGGWDQRMLADWRPGEAGAHELLEAFVDGALRGYGEQRNLLDRTGTSRMSPHLHFGEISPRQLVAALLGRTWPAAVQGDVEKYLAELGWREFAHHQLFHSPRSTDHDGNPRFEGFRWAAPDPALLAAWQRGRTGVPLVDAAMRELWATGWMHGRARMVVAGFLTKNLRMHWRHGAKWFWDTLVDADLANNTLGWQWCAGTGADAAPYLRVFNPATQADRFDPNRRYLRRWLPELAAVPDSHLAAPWTHPRIAQLAPDYPAPVVDLKASREEAMAAYADAGSH